MSDRSAWGLEVSGGWRTDTGTSPSQTTHQDGSISTGIADIDRESYFADIGLTAQRFRPTEYKVKPLVAARVEWSRSPQV